jgi:hypothetical protein
LKIWGDRNRSQPWALGIKLISVKIHETVKPDGDLKKTVKHTVDVI